MKEHDAETLLNAVESSVANQNFGKGKRYNQAGRGRKGFFKDNVYTHYEKNRYTVDICYRNHGYPSRWGARRGNAFANNVGTYFQEVNTEMKMKGTDERNMSLT